MGRKKYSVIIIKSKYLSGNIVKSSNIKIYINTYFDSINWPLHIYKKKGRGRNSDMGWILFTEGSNLEKQSLQASGYFRHRLACAVFSLFFSFLFG